MNMREVRSRSWWPEYCDCGCDCGKPAAPLAGIESEDGLCRDCAQGFHSDDADDDADRQYQEDRRLYGIGPLR